jgi:hypothetical protein
MREAVTAVVPAATDPSWTDIAAAAGALVAALAAVATVIVAVVAARYAKKQVDGVRDQLTEARALRREQAQPYVVVSAVPNRVSPHAVEIVIQNLGTTGARDVRIACSPPLVRTDQLGGAEQVRLPEVIPFLAPGQEWRTFWDHGVERGRDIYDLPDRYDITATYTDSFDTSHTTPSMLDWSVFRQRMWVTERTVHDAAKTLESIDKTLKALTRADRIQRVATYDGPELDRQHAEEAEESLRQLKELEAEITRVRTEPGHPENGQGNRGT